MKKCPFCKKEIPKISEKCVHCNLTLIEKIPHKEWGSIPVSSPVDHHKSSPESVKAFRSKYKIIFKKLYRYKVLISIGIAVLFIIFANYLSSDNIQSSAQDNTIPRVTDIIPSTSSNYIPVTEYKGPAPTLPSDIHKIAPIAPLVGTIPKKIQTSGYVPVLGKNDPTNNYVPVLGPQNVPATYIPPTVQTQFVANGAIFKGCSSYPQGDGELQISNGTSHDALAKLVLANASVCTVYITAGDSYTIKNISDGYYNLLFNLGNGWDPADQVFANNNDYEKFDDGFNFTTYKTDTGDYIDTHYTTFSVSLNPVIGGTATTNPVDPTEFNNY